MKKGLLLIAMFFGLCLSFDTRAENFNVQEFYRDTGLQVIVIENHKAPIIQQMLFYKVGAVDEKPGQGGIAHLLEHLMFRGTTKVDGQLFNQILEQNGAESNAFTAQDITAYYQFMDISRLELAMFLEADRMQGLDLNKRNFKTERDIVFQERKQRVDNNPTALFFEKVRAVLWQEHPYGKPVTGQDREIDNLTQNMAKEFYESYYAPNNAILILSGDIEPQVAKSLAEKYFGEIEPRKVGLKADFPKLDKQFDARLEMKLPQIKAERMVKLYVAPSVNLDKTEVYPLMVLAAYLGEGETSKLYKKLVLQEKAALGVSVSYDYASRSYGGFSISATPKEDIKTEDFEAALNKAIKQAVAEITIEEIEKTKAKMLAGQVYLRDNPNDAAYIVGAMAAVGMSVEEIENHAENIRKVSAAEVRQAAKKLFGGAISVTGIVKPAEEAN